MLCAVSGDLVVKIYVVKKQPHNTSMEAQGEE
jgi:hypothetical protein